MRSGSAKASGAQSRPPSPQSGASGWIGAFLILIAILAWGHVKLGGEHPPVSAASHATLSR